MPQKIKPCAKKNYLLVRIAKQNPLVEQAFKITVLIFRQHLEVRQLVNASFIKHSFLKKHGVSCQLKRKMVKSVCLFLKPRSAKIKSKQNKMFQLFPSSIYASS